METAIVMPLFVFIILGLLQLGLLHQTRLLTKYAAYKAVRAGSINRAKMDVMTNAAVAVMMPLLTKPSPRWSGDGRRQPQYQVYNVSSAQKYKQAFTQHIQQPNGPFSKQMVEVTICSPTKSDGVGKDFDDFRTSPGDWEAFDNTKLAVQVTTYMPLYIPYANAFIWWAARGENSSAERAATMKTLRMKTGDTSKKSGEDRVIKNGQANKGKWTRSDLENEAQNGNYVLPVRASYAMRMHSNLDDNFQPTPEDCHIPWERK